MTKHSELTDEQQNIVVAVGQASDPHTPAGVLDILAHHDDHRVRRAVAGNTSCPGYLLHRLSSDTSWVVRRATVETPSSPNEVLCHLAHDKVKEVRDAAKDNLRSRTRLARDCDCGEPHEPSIP